MINRLDWAVMTDQEREALTFTLLDITPDEIDQLIQEFKVENGKAPNAIFVSADSLIKLPARIKYFKRPAAKLTVIPMDADPGHFIVSLQDPYVWGNLFFR